VPARIALHFALAWALFVNNLHKRPILLIAAALFLGAGFGALALFVGGALSG